MGGGAYGNKGETHLKVGKGEKKGKNQNKTTGEKIKK